MICARCGRHEAFSSVKLAEFVKRGGPAPPALPPELCLKCIADDPAYRPLLDAWKDQLVAWAKEQFAPQVRALRKWLARPLEAIDEFVESLR